MKAAIASLAILFATVAALPKQQYGTTVHASGGLPVAGEVWGPVITHVGTMQDTQDGLMHKYSYGKAGRQDVLVDYILTSDIFDTAEEMYGHVNSVTEEGHVVVQANPAALEGKFLEILTTKVVPKESVKITCHSYMTKPAFCHRLGFGGAHRSKMMYSLVKEMESGKVFPTVFFGHEGCSEENNDDSCYWVSHINEVVILDKSLI